MPFLDIHLDELYRNGKILKLIPRRNVASMAVMTRMT